jgi:hypothetical protein
MLIVIIIDASEPDIIIFYIAGVTFRTSIGGVIRVAIFH